MLKNVTLPYCMCCIYLYCTGAFIVTYYFESDTLLECGADIVAKESQDGKTKDKHVHLRDSSISKHHVTSQPEDPEISETVKVVSLLDQYLQNVRKTGSGRQASKTMTSPLAEHLLSSFITHGGSGYVAASTGNMVKTQQVSRYEPKQNAAAKRPKRHRSTKPNCVACIERMRSKDNTGVEPSLRASSPALTPRWQSASAGTNSLSSVHVPLQPCRPHTVPHKPRYVSAQQLATRPSGTDSGSHTGALSAHQTYKETGRDRSQQRLSWSAGQTYSRVNEGLVPPPRLPAGIPSASDVLRSQAVLTLTSEYYNHQLKMPSRGIYGTFL